MISEYVPTDLSTIKRETKIKNQYEFEQEIANISEVLKDLSSTDCSGKKFFSLKELQMVDQRSALTKEASKTIALMAEVMQDQFEILAQRFIHPNSLIKLVQNANKIISEHGHLCIIAILHNVVSAKIVNKIFDEAKNKSPIVRSKVAQYFLAILLTYPEEIVDRQSQIIEDYLFLALSDAKPEVRQNARMSQAYDNLSKNSQANILSRKSEPVICSKTQPNFYGVAPNKNMSEFDDNQSLSSINSINSKMSKINLNNNNNGGNNLARTQDNFDKKTQRQKQNMPLPDKSTDFEQILQPHAYPSSTENHNQRSSKRQKANYIDLPIQQDEETFDKMLQNDDYRQNNMIIQSFKKDSRGVSSSNKSGGSQFNQNQQNSNDQIQSKLQLLKSRSSQSQQNQLSHQNSNVQSSQIDDDSLSSIAHISNSIITERNKSVRNAQESGCVEEEVFRKPSSKSQIKQGKVYLEDSELVELKRKLSNPGYETAQQFYQEAGASQTNQFPRQTQQHAGQFELNQNIEMLLEKAEKENWSERLEAFIGLQQIIYEWIAIMGEARAMNQQLTFQHLQVTQENIFEILKCMVNHLGDNHFKVVLIVQDSMCQIFQLFHEMFAPYLQVIIEKLLKNVTDKKESVCSSANILLNMFQQIYGGDQLVPILLKILDKAETIQNKVLISCLEVLMVLLKDAYQFAMSEDNIKNCVIKVCLIASDNSANKAVTLPIIGALLTLRDKNVNASMQAILMLDSKTLEIIKRLGHFYAPDLEENIVEFINKRNAQYEGKDDMPLSQIDDSPRTILENKKQKLLTKNPHQNQYDIPNAMKSPKNMTNNKVTPNSSITRATINFEESKITKTSKIQQKVMDMSVLSNKEEDEEMLSFLMIENQVKKQSTQQSDDILNTIIQSQNIQKQVQDLDLNQRIELLKKIQQSHVDSKKDGQMGFTSQNLESILTILNLLLNSQQTKSNKNDEQAMNVQSEFKERTLEIMTIIIQENFKRFVDITKQSQNNLFESLMQALILNFNENKYISKKSEAIFDILVAYSHKQQQYSALIMKTLFKLNQIDQQQYSGILLPVILRFTAKIIKIIVKQTLVSIQEDVFRSLLLNNMNHPNPEVRKNVVFCLVEMRIIVGEYDFQSIFQRLPMSQQKLVQIYIERRQGNQTSTSSQISSQQTGGKIL
ncbi:clip-associating protein [Stylonychia lemnae]|uniref:Clip-associating protein n=1 Tax=Stylonychia lemnae TaxID=5949 RepID=A0A078B0Y0_STYLE|nr:clip-associating protein [Stylonychia lemnae]|eukprot:CDW87981.1 clip-associating protein [Stylonychia lemnae]